MLEVKGLPIQITQSDLDELFKDYGEVQRWYINDQGAVLVQLDKNEELAFEKLDRTQWRRYILHLDFRRGEESPCEQIRSGGKDSQQDCS